MPAGPASSVMATLMRGEDGAVSGGAPTPGGSPVEESPGRASGGTRDRGTAAPVVAARQPHALGAQAPEARGHGPARVLGDGGATAPAQRIGAHDLGLSGARLQQDDLLAGLAQLSRLV